MATISTSIPVAILQWVWHSEKRRIIFKDDDSRPPLPRRAEYFSHEISDGILEDYSFLQRYHNFLSSFDRDLEYAVESGWLQKRSDFNTFKYSLTKKGEGIVIDIENSEREINEKRRTALIIKLDLAVTRMPYYGDFIPGFMFGTPEFKNIKDRMDHLMMVSDVMRLLKDNGFIIERKDLPQHGSDYAVQLTERGRELKEIGGWSMFFAKEERKKQIILANERRQATEEKRNTYLFWATVSIAVSTASARWSS